MPASETPVVGEVPEAILLRVREDLATRAQANVSGAVVVVAQQVVWNDGSLGCPERGVLYTQALVPGYQVVLELDGQRFDYRSDERGIVRLCEPRAPAAQP
ncbi:MAG: hypothetical protein M3R57_03465 [Chloroflexota bacterium]|nr:hypothetical protein [Chloroflexota bacterium]